MTPITIENWKEFNEWCDKKDASVSAKELHPRIITWTFQPRTLEAMLTWLANGKK